MFVLCLYYVCIMFVLLLMRTEAINDETLLVPNFIILTKTRQQNEEYDMVKLQVKTDKI